MPRLSVEAHLLVTVHVDTDSGEIEYVYAHGDCLAEQPQELPAMVYGNHDPLLSDSERLDGEGYVPEEDPLHAEALALFERVRLASPEFFIPFQLENEQGQAEGDPTYGTLLPNDAVRGWGEGEHHNRLSRFFDAERDKDAGIRDQALEAEVTQPLQIGARKRLSPLAERLA